MVAAGRPPVLDEDDARAPFIIGARRILLLRDLADQGDLAGQPFGQFLRPQDMARHVLEPAFGARETGEVHARAAQRHAHADRALIDEALVAGLHRCGMMFPDSPPVETRHGATSFLVPS